MVSYVHVICAKVPIPGSKSAMGHTQCCLIYMPNISAEHILGGKGNIPKDVSAFVVKEEGSAEIGARDIAPIEMLEGYYHQLEEVLLNIGYLYPHTAKRRMEKFRLLFNRSQLSPNEVAMLRGILRQIEWALQSASTKPETSPNDEC